MYLPCPTVNSKSSSINEQTERVSTIVRIIYKNDGAKAGKLITINLKPIPK